MGKVGSVERPETIGGAVTVWGGRVGDVVIGWSVVGPEVIGASVINAGGDVEILSFEGPALGESDLNLPGRPLGLCDGIELLVTEGLFDGLADAIKLGTLEGCTDDSLDGMFVTLRRVVAVLGKIDGAELGSDDGDNILEGDVDGASDGKVEGKSDGEILGEPDATLLGL